jgi:cbb3-type cytochrome oxidase maturation protein
LARFGLVAFLWSLRSGQFDALDGAAVRILREDGSPADRRQLPGKGRNRGPV